MVRHGSVLRLAAAAMCAASLIVGPTRDKSANSETPFPTMAEPHRLIAFSPSTEIGTEGPTGCEGMLDKFCDALFSPEARGNLKIGTSGSIYNIYHGSTDNDLATSYYVYASIKLKRRQYLPQDFRTSLERQGYFQTLQSYLARPPLKKMTAQDRIRDVRIQYQLGSIWSAAQEEILIQRMRKIHPEYHSQREDLLPLDLKWERDRTRRALLSEIAAALWVGHPNWKKVEKSFNEVQKHLLATIDALDIPDRTRLRWRARIKSVRLVLPGSLPEIADEECATTEANAYYYPRINVLTVCAGDFNSEDIYQTLAHELSHSIDAGSLAETFRAHSELGLTLRSLRGQSCSKRKIDCEQWRDFKSDLEDYLSEWNEYEHDVPDFQTCLQSARPPKDLSEETLQRAADHEVDASLARLADSHTFLRLTKEKLPYPDGTWKPNPSYMNACRSDRGGYPSNLFDTEEMVVQFFVAEYQCQDTSSFPAGSSAALESAIAEARHTAARVTRAVLDMDREFSSNDSLVQGGYATPSDERFADVIGSYTLARLLQEEPDLLSRRKLYFASSSWQCSRPSLAKLFPDEARIERRFSFDAHSAGKERMRENLSEPIRQALSCSKDFDFNECSIPFKEH